MSRPAEALLAIARREAIAETSAALSAAARDALVRHGAADPESLLLLEAGILSFLKNTEFALPGFRARLLRNLEASR